jgi:response regulator RpfG family c-di-GMP phosphodiesterase
MVKITRSLSVGDFEKNAKKQLALMSLHLSNLYENPLHDENLDVQFKSTTNLAKFLIDNKGLNPNLYQQLKKQNHHFVIAQPMLLSLLLLGYLKHLAIYQDREIENLFITSMMKDIGMSFVPNDKFNKFNLSTQEKEMFSHHPESSKSILEGRVPLSRNYLSIIENHHHFNTQISQILTNNFAQAKSSTDLVGFETLIVAVMDIIVAMTEGRPYRNKSSIFESLDLIKHIMLKEYPHEFKTLVIYLKQFFTNY